MTKSRLRESIKRIEITGPSCSGKSYYLSQHQLPFNRIPAYFAALGLVFACLESPKGVWFLLKKTARSDRSLWHILRVGIHVFAKFGFQRRGLGSTSDVVIDEGISHIPFILMMSKKDVALFMKYFSDSIAQLHVIFVRASPEQIRSRMLQRGHKRIRTNKDLNHFYRNHTRLMDEYLGLLHDLGVSVQVLDD